MLDSITKFAFSLQGAWFRGARSFQGTAISQSIVITPTTNNYFVVEKIYLHASIISSSSILATYTYSINGTNIISFNSEVGETFDSEIPSDGDSISVNGTNNVSFSVSSNSTTHLDGFILLAGIYQ